MPINNLGTASGKIDVDSNSLKNADISLRSAGRGMLAFGAIAVGAFAAVVGEAAKFESEMDFVKAITQASGDQMDALKAKAIDMGKKSIFGPVELSKAFVDMVKAGATVDEMLGGLAEAAVALAQAADIPIPFAGENLLNILNTFNLTAADATDVVNSLAGAANASSVDVNDMVASLQYAGPVAHAMGLNVEEVNAALAILGKVGIRGSIAGTSLRMGLSRLTGVSGAAKDALEGVGLTVKDGMVKEFTNADGTLKSLSDVMEVLRVHTADLGGQAKVTFAGDVFGVRAMPAFIKLMEGGSAAFVEMDAEIGRSSAADVASKRLDNLAGSVAKLKATIQTMMTEAGGPFQTMLKGWVDGLRNMLLWFDNLPGPIKSFIVGAVGVIGVLSLFAGAFLLTIGNIVRMIRVVKEISGLLRTFSLVSRGAAAANTALNASFLLSPIFLITAAVIAAAAAFYLLYTRVKGFHDFIDNVWQDIQAGWDGITKGAKDTVKNVGDAVDAFRGGFENPFAKISDSVQGQDRVFLTFGAGVRRALDGIKEGFSNLPGQIVHVVGNIQTFFATVGRAIGGFFVRLYNTVKNALVGAALAVGRFFESLPGVIQRALSRAGGWLVDWLSKLPARIAYWTGFAIGRWFRFWYYDIPRVVIKAGQKVLPAIGRFMISVRNLFFQMTVSVLRTVTGWGESLFNLFVSVFARIVNAVVGEMTALPGQIGAILASIVTWLETMVPQLVQSGLNIGFGIFDAIMGFFGRLPGEAARVMAGILSWIINTTPQIISAAYNIGKGVFDAVIGFFEDLPANIGQWLLDAALAVGSFAGTFYEKAKSIATSLWNGFHDGLFGSPHTKIEYAMWDMTANMGRSIDQVKNHIGVLNSLQNKIPQLNAGAIGLPSAADAALTMNGGGQIWQQNAPLIGNATIRDDRDIVTLARQLETERQRTERARGRN